jgi:hypothetical protein
MKSVGPVVMAAAFGALACAFISVAVSAVALSRWSFAASAVAAVLSCRVVGQVVAYDAEDRARHS